MFAVLSRHGPSAVDLNIYLLFFKHFVNKSDTEINFIQNECSQTFCTDTFRFSLCVHRIRVDKLRFG